jgi:hypothetical protein
MPEEHPMAIADRKVLLFDEHYTQSKRGFETTIHKPVRDLEPVVRPDQPWERRGIIGDSNITVLEDRGLYRMWYAIPHPQPEAGRLKPAYTAEEIADLDTKMKADLLKGNGATVLCYAESRDGLHWEKPDCGLMDFNGSTANNMLFPSRHGGTVFVDPTAKPAERYKMIHGHGPRLPQVYQTGPQPVPARNIFCALYGSVSPDGIHWTTTPEPIMHWYADTTNVAYWDRDLGKYVAFVRWNQNLTFQDGKTVIMERGAEHYRCVGRSESADFFRFPPPLKIAEPSPEERRPRATGMDYYNTAAVKHPDCPDAYFLFSSNFHHEQDILEATLSASRDGVRYTRWTDPILGPGYEGTWDSRSIYMATGILARGNEMFMYYGGRDWRHGESNAKGSGAVGRVRYRRDGFVSQTASARGGELTTRPIRFEGRRLEVNFDAGAGGRIKAEILDGGGTPVPGFTAEEADWQFYNDTARTLTWKGNPDVSALAGRSIKLRFIAKSASVFAFQFRHPS